MAKETKAERQLRIAIEADKAARETQASYPTRLMAVLARAQRIWCDIHFDAVEMEFVVIFRDSGNLFRVQFEWDPIMADEYLEDLTYSVGNIELVKAMEAERLATRARALDKLTEEERQALGV